VLALRCWRRFICRTSGYLPGVRDVYMSCVVRSSRIERDTETCSDTPDPDEHSTDLSMTRDRRVGLDQPLHASAPCHNQANIFNDDVRCNSRLKENLSSDRRASHTYLQFTIISVELSDLANTAFTVKPTPHPAINYPDTTRPRHGKTTSNNSNPLNRQHGLRCSSSLSSS
jgi:predicted nucleic acid-binding Zn ribbon protein